MAVRKKSCDWDVWLLCASRANDSAILPRPESTLQRGEMWRSTFI